MLVEGYGQREPRNLYHARKRPQRVKRRLSPAFTAPPREVQESLEVDHLRSRKDDGVPGEEVIHSASVEHMYVHCTYS